jgi:predicted O-methyltransferase YrrM
MILFRTCKYAKYIFLSKSRKGHGIHSPFVFDLVSRVFRNKTNPAIVSCVEGIRRELTDDHRMLKIMDLGKGSEKMDIHYRKVSDILRNSAVPAKYGNLLSNMAAEYGERKITEMGTSLGISTMYMALSSETRIDTIEGCSAIAEVAKENFDRAGIKNVNVYSGSFEEILPLLINENSKPGLVFIDGNHRKEPVIKYFNHIADVSDHETVVIIDDINHSSEMGDAWNVIKKCHKISVTVDIFRMGIVFFRKGISRTDYIIRY